MAIILDVYGYDKDGGGMCLVDHDTVSGQKGCAICNEERQEPHDGHSVAASRDSAVVMTYT